MPSYLLLSAGFFVCGFHIAFFQTHLPAIVARAGLSPGIGAAALAIVGAFNIVGSYASGRLADRYPKRYVLSAIYGLRFVAIGLFALLPISALTRARVLVGDGRCCGSRPSRRPAASSPRSSACSGSRRCSA